MDHYKKTLIYFFSGTGNARRIASWFSEFAETKKIECQTFDLSKISPPKKEEIDPSALIVFISPIHGFNYPKITLDFIINFPKGNNHVVLMNTRAGMKIGNWVTPGLTGIAFLFSALILKIKGYKIDGLIPFDMPSNWISIHPSLNDNTVRFLHLKNHEKVQRHAAKIFFYGKDFVALKDIIQDLLISPVSIGYFLIGRFLFAKSFYASPACNNCESCIKNCPVNAIKSLQGRPYWTFDCESCMKCMNTCPHNAIETAHGLFLMTGILSAPVFGFLSTHFIDLGISEFFQNIVSTVFFLIVLWGSYHIQHRMLVNGKLGTIITAFSLTHLKKWGRYKSIPDSKWKNGTEI